MALPPATTITTTTTTITTICWTGSDVTSVPSALCESLTVNRDDKTHQISASAVIGWFLQYRRSFLVLSVGQEKGSR